jgi:hypothetical protein
MSSHVRDVFRTALTAASSAPYFETIGVPLDLNTVPALWVTLEFPQTTSERVAIGFPSCLRDSGVVVVHALGRSGQGEDAVFNLIESIRPAFDKPYLQDVRLTGTQPAFLFPADDGEWLDAVFQIGYAWDHRA